MQTRAHDIYDSIGGMETCHRLSHLFHQRVARDPVLSALFPKSFSTANERMALFLAELMGGPADHSAQRGHTALEGAHGHLRIGTGEVEAWMKAMSAAMEDTGIPQPARHHLRCAL